jgi:hypothetical protein
MTRAAVPPILLQLHSSESVSSQAESLRTLKNELIGHDQSKETYVTSGVLPALAQVLSTYRPGGVASADPNGSAPNPVNYRTSSEYEACLQSILIVGSVAQGA